MNSENRQVSHERLMHDLFLVTKGTECIAFSPLQRTAFAVRPAGAEALKRFLQSGQDLDGRIRSFIADNRLLRHSDPPPTNLGKPYRPTALILALTSACNLRCIYCYASAGPKPVTMNWNTVLAAIQAGVQSAIDSSAKTFRLTFHGGGEPTMAWELLVRATEHTVLVCRDARLPVSFSLVTNGTLIDPEKARWLGKHQFRLTVSVDGLREVQDMQRPKANGGGSYSDVLVAMRNLGSNEVDYGIRTTITGHNVSRMSELVTLASQVGARRIKVEPFTPAGRGQSGIPAVDPHLFLVHFQQARELARSLDIKFESSASRVDRPRTRFCGADGNILCVLPDGQISSCTRVTRAHDKLAEIFLVGRVSEGRICVDPGKIERLRHLVVNEFSQCKDCFARWHCAGGCHSERLSGDGNMPTDHCTIVRDLLWSFLSEKVKF